MIKKRLMVALWRVQQAQTVISIVFWSLTLAGVFYPYIADKWLDDALGAKRVALGMLIIMGLVVLGILSAGYMYDRLRFWREQAIVLQERNPFSYGPKVAPTLIILWDAAINQHDTVAQANARKLLAHALTDDDLREAYDRIIQEVSD